jgi:hypothetical protein
MTDSPDWAQRFIQTEPAVAPEPNPAFDILMDGINDAVREAVASNLTEYDINEKIDRVVAAIASLAEGTTQQMVMLARRINDLERVLEEQNQPQPTNLMHDAPGVAARLADFDDDEDPFEENEDEHMVFQYRDGHIKWVDLVKYAGGVAAAADLRDTYAGATEEEEDE